MAETIKIKFCDHSPAPKRLGQGTRGFTLVEAMVTTILLSVIYGGCLMLLLSGSDSYQINSNQVQLQQEMRKSLDWLKEDLYEGIASTITGVPTDGTWQTSITLRKSTGVSGGSMSPSNNITYSRDTSNNHLQRVVSGLSTRIIATNITTFQVRRQSTAPKVVEVYIEATQNTLRGIPLVLSSTFKAQLRN